MAIVTLPSLINCCTSILEASVFPAPLSPDTTQHCMPLKSISTSHKNLCYLMFTVVQHTLVGIASYSKYMRGQLYIRAPSNALILTGNLQKYRSAEQAQTTTMGTQLFASLCLVQSNDTISIQAANEKQYLNAIFTTNQFSNTYLYTYKLYSQQSLCTNLIIVYVQFLEGIHRHQDVTNIRVDVLILIAVHQLTHEYILRIEIIRVSISQVLFSHYLINVLKLC